MSTISYRSSLALFGWSARVAYAGVWILCRTRLRRFGTAAFSADCIATMGKGAVLALHHISAGMWKSMQEVSEGGRPQINRWYIRWGRRADAWERQPTKTAALLCISSKHLSPKAATRPREDSLLIEDGLVGDRQGGP